MSSPSTDSPTALFAAAADELLSALSRVTAADLDRPTPCHDWDLRTLVLHVASTSDVLAGMATSDYAAPAPADAGDPVVGARAHVVAFRDLVASSDPESVEQVAQIGSIEYTTHSWDVAAALDPTADIPESLAAPVLTLASAMLPDDARGDNFEASLAPPADADTGNRLIAFLGRRRPASAE